MRTIAVVSQKGGVGKTVTTSNIAVVAADLGLRVLMIDLDPQHHLSVHWWLERSGRENIFECDVPEPLETRVPGVDLIPGNRRLQGIEGNLYATRNVVCLWDILQKKIRPLQYDVVLLDCPPNLDGCTENAIAAAHTILIPIVMARTNIAVLSETMALVDKLKREVPGRYSRVTEDIVGVATHYKNTAPQRRTFERARSHEALRGISWCETTIRTSAIYERAEEEGLPATVIGARNSYPVVDYTSLAREIGLADDLPTAVAPVRIEATV